VAVIGQEVVTRLLPLPPVSLFQGPRSVGKWTAAEWCRWRLDIGEGDTLRLSKLRVADAEALTRFSLAAPFGSGRLAIVQMDGATVAASNHLLSVLEEIPSTTRVILVASRPVLDTLVSRAEVFPFHLLSAADVASVLMSKRRMKESQAEEWAKHAGGQVFRALLHAEHAENKPLVLQAVRAIREREPETLERLADKWKDEHTALLTRWANEAMTQRFALYTEEEATIVDRSVPMKILMALRADVRPRLVVRASLVGVVRSLM
jgi:hypothetical protein